MKIIALADEPNHRLWGEKCREMLEGVDLILSCGDLSSNYLTYLTCFSHAPVVYVHGNHDTQYEQKPPHGCICAEDRIVQVEGLRILGLGGCMRYRPDAPFMYTEAEMKRRVLKLMPRLHCTGGFDILLTHAPMLGLGDQEDLPHRGFAVFQTLLDKYHPAVMFHGHVHQQYSGSHFKRENVYHDIPVINASESVYFTLPDHYTPQKKPMFLGQWQLNSSAQRHTVQEDLSELTMDKITGKR